MVTDEMVERAWRAYQDFGWSTEEGMRAALTAALAQAEQPVAWVKPSDHNCRSDGFIDAMAWSEGEFTKPLFASPVPTDPDKGDTL